MASGILERALSESNRNGAWGAPGAGFRGFFCRGVGRELTRNGSCTVDLCCASRLALAGDLLVFRLRFRLLGFRHKTGVSYFTP